MSAREELDRVQLEPERVLTEEDIDDMSESAPSVEEEEPEYEVDEHGEMVEKAKHYPTDAIKYAHYKDTTRIKEEGKKGWHYGVMWKGYLKSASDTEEPYDCFLEPGQGASSLLREFWASVGRPLRGHGKDPEPLPRRRNELVECPDGRMRAWLKETKPHRYFDVYKRRRGKEKEGRRITRADSDYYVRLKRKAEARRKKQQEAAAAAAAVDSSAAAGPSGTSTTAQANDESDEPGPSVAAPAAGEDVREDETAAASAIGKGKRKAQIPSSPSPSLEDGAAMKKSKTADAVAAPPRATSKSKSPARRAIRRIESPPPPLPPAFEPAPGIFDLVTPTSAPLPAEMEEVAEPPSRRSEPLFDEVGDDADDADEVEADTAIPEVELPARKSTTPPAPPAPAAKLATTPQTTSAPVQSLPSPPPTAPTTAIAPPAPTTAKSPPAPTTAKSPTFRAQPLPMLNLGSASTSTGATFKSPPSAISALTPANAALPTPPTSALSAKSPRQPRKRMSEALIDPEVAAKLAKKGIKPSKKVHVPAGLRGSTDPSIVHSAPTPPPGNVGTLPVRPHPIPEVPVRTGPPVHIGSFVPPPAPAVTPAVAPTAPAAQRVNFVSRPPPQRITATNNQPLAGQPRWGQKEPPTGPAPPRTAPTGPSASAGLPARPLGVVLPALGGTSPTTYGGASPNNVPAPAYNASADPRRRPAVPPVATGVSPALGTQALTTVSAPREPAGPRPPAPPAMRAGSGTKVIEIINTVRLSIPRKGDLDVILYRGASHATADITLGEIPSGSTSAMNFEILDGFCLAGQLKHGARVLEWAKVALPFDAKPDVKRDWDDIKVQAKAGKILACYTENPKIPEIDSHYAIVLVSADRMDFSAIPLEGWAVEEIEVAAIMVALPLDSDAPPLLPNPVRPLASQTPKNTPRKPWASRGPRKLPILRSYGLDEKFLAGLRSKVVHYRLPTTKTHLDELFRRVEAAFKQYDVQPVKPDRPTNLLLLPNDRLYSAVQSGTLRENVPRRTAIMSVGPTLSLLPSQWKVREIWESGGLVTFSPTFILRSPAKFLEIMQLIRSAEHWAAYIIPAVIEWADSSWAEPTRCPDAPATYSALTSSLFLDQHSSRLSGKGAVVTGGLAVSTCPPSVHKTQACAEWSEWLHTISTAREYSSLAKQAKGVAPEDWEKGRPAVNGAAWVRPGSPRKGGLELVDVERAQLDDLTAMRQRPDLLPYRRYLYIGQVSLDRKAKEIIGNSIEFIAADDFEAVFSGAV